ncbi:MAG TPA: hypothetical protein VNK95_23640, partial [Caldilineaceae bacterium]|nr:hypothetical protein [Caldilineaceae bacterium]
IHPAVAAIGGVSLYNLSDLEWALLHSAPIGLARAGSLPAWVTALPVVTEMVQAETTALWKWIDRPWLYPRGS